MTADDRPPLRLAPPPGAERPDTRVSIALALLAPLEPALDNSATNALCPDGKDTTRADQLLTDPRYIIGRLHQALTALLSDHIPPPDATARLLAEALSDAIAYREPDSPCPQCEPDESMCPQCWQHSRKAGQYKALAADLGIIEEPTAPPSLTLIRASTSASGTTIP